MESQSGLIKGRLALGEGGKVHDGPEVEGRLVEGNWSSFGREMFELMRPVSFVSPHDGSTVTWEAGEKLQLDMVHFI